jgi:D-alanyl-D-alanine carboxypeptidase/D-alanyl-D-alanine-endopeptidase (penicillin-binding protein 4)
VELRHRLLLSLACVALGSPGAAHADLAQLRALTGKGARVTAAVVDLSTGRTLEQLEPGTRLGPASLTKLVITAAALEAWPVDRTFDTAVLADRAPRDGVIAGDLILRGGGDATLDDEKLWLLAAQVRDAGVREVTGRLVVSPTTFGTLPCETRDRCQGLERSDRAYNAVLSSIGVDFGNWCVLVRPGAVGADAELRTCTGTALPIPVEGRITTAGAETRSSIQVERLTANGIDRLRVRGSVPAGDVERVYRAMSDPSLATGQLLREMLLQLGVKMPPAVMVSPVPLVPSAVKLAEVEGLQLKEQVGRMMRYSNNYIADVLTLNLAAEQQRGTPQRLSAASEVLLQYLLRTRDPASPLPTELPVLASGSGLTPENRLSAQDLTQLLGRMYRDARRFPAFYGSLVVPRDAPFAFLKRGGDAWLDRVALKTGTMNEPYSVAGIAGYLRRKDGGWLSFAIIVNGSERRRQIPLAEALGAAREDLEGVLARY